MDKTPDLVELRAKAVKWDNIATAWKVYCEKGAGVFDWDYDSRDLMRELTDYAAFIGKYR